jgi:ABC-type nitrate/sulfonate/bicarbonate transport system permease component
MEIKQGFNKVIDDFGHVLGILIIWVYLLVFIWASAGIGVFIAYYKKRAYYVQIFALIFVLSSIALGIMTLA